MRKRDDYNGYMRAYMQRRYEEHREFALSVLGNQCARCGWKHELEIANKDPLQRSQLTKRQWSASKDVLRKALSHCVLLCRACNRERKRLAQHREVPA
jgi:hypothetical protein